MRWGVFNHDVEILGRAAVVAATVASKEVIDRPITEVRVLPAEIEKK